GRARFTANQQKANANKCAQQQERAPGGLDPKEVDPRLGYETLDRQARGGVIGLSSHIEHREPRKIDRESRYRRAGQSECDPSIERKCDEGEDEARRRREAGEVVRVEQDGHRKGQAEQRSSSVTNQGEEEVDRPDSRQRRNRVVASLADVEEERNGQRQEGGG